MNTRPFTFAAVFAALAAASFTAAITLPPYFPASEPLPIVGLRGLSDVSDV